MVQVNSVHLLINIVLILYWIVEQAISPHPKKSEKSQWKIWNLDLHVISL